MTHDTGELVALFNNLFIERYRTELIAGGEEPIYLPGESDGLHRIIFTRDYYASALHEVSHWCIAGDSRRQQVDFGYWYEPDGRSFQQQKAFEEVEVKPQALEWIFSEAAGVEFRVSVDNFNFREYDCSTFREKVCHQAAVYLRQGLSARPRLFAEALIEHYQRNHHFSAFKARLIGLN